LVVVPKSTCEVPGTLVVQAMVAEVVVMLLAATPEIVIEGGLLGGTGSELRTPAAPPHPAALPAAARAKRDSSTAVARRRDGIGLPLGMATLLAVAARLSIGTPAFLACM